MEVPLIRKATNADIGEIQSLFLQGDVYHAQRLPGVFRAVERARPDELVESRITNEESDFLVAIVDSQVVGFLEISMSARPPHPMFLPRRHAVIENMVVDDGHRDRGIGTRLLHGARAWAEQRGLPAIQLTVWSENAEARRLYEREGYHPIMYRMELDL